MTWVIRQGTRCRRLNHRGRIKLDRKVSGAITADRPGSTRATYRPDSKSTKEHQLLCPNGVDADRGCISRSPSRRNDA